MTFCCEERLTQFFLLNNNKVIDEKRIEIKNDNFLWVDHEKNHLTKQKEKFLRPFYSFRTSIQKIAKFVII